MKILPKIIKENNSFSFLIDNRPYIMLAAETHNSACTSRQYMQIVWKKAKELNCNTILAPVYWEIIEPHEDEYNFLDVEQLILDARQFNMHLVLLWFGSWKNGCSTYAPGWVKTDFKRFPRVENEAGQKTKILSMFQSDILEAEKKAFSSFMKFLRSFDASEQTVIAVQVENEVGILGTTRDFSYVANQRYSEQVPEKLMAYLKYINSRKYCFDDTIATKSWKEVFGEYSEEAFMSWNYANYINSLAENGKKNYELPMFTNAWQKEFDDEKPGFFPCGGPLPSTLDIWKCGAPLLDVLSPDIYTYDFKKVSDLYRREDNPLFIPETRRDKRSVANLYLAIGRYNTLCYSPFGLESIGENKSFITQRIHTDSNDKNVSSPLIKDYLAQSYQMIGNMMPIITKYYGTNCMIGFAQDEVHLTEHLIIGSYRIVVEYYHQVDDNNEYIPGAGIIILENASELIFMGYGYRAYIESVNLDMQLDFLILEKGIYDENTDWNRTMLLNGDEQHVQMEESPTVLRAVYYEI